MRVESNDHSELQKWRWSVRKAEKINNERHALRCDIELKLMVYIYLSSYYICFGHQINQCHYSLTYHK